MNGDGPVKCPGPGEKRCSWCNQIKPLTEFYRSSYNYLGVQSKCKDCDRQWRRDRQSKGWVQR